MVVYKDSALMGVSSIPCNEPELPVKEISMVKP